MALAALVYERVALLDRRLPQSSVAICAAHEIAVSWQSYWQFTVCSLQMPLEPTERTKVQKPQKRPRIGVQFFRGGKKLRWSKNQQDLRERLQHAHHFETEIGRLSSGELLVRSVS